MNGRQRMAIERIENEISAVKSELSQIEMLSRILVSNKYKEDALSRQIGDTLTHLISEKLININDKIDDIWQFIIV